MHCILLSHCCNRGYRAFKSIVEAKQKTIEQVTTERRHVHSRTIDIMDKIKLTSEDVRLSPYVLECDDQRNPIKWYKVPR